MRKSRIIAPARRANRRDSFRSNIASRRREELAWKLYHDALGVEIGARQQLRGFDLADPLVGAKLRERYGEHVPLNEPVISPAAMYDSPLLTTVVSR